MNVYLVVHDIDIETSQIHGVFSAPDIAVGYIERQARGKLRPWADGVTFTDLGDMTHWGVDTYVLDEEREGQ